jgi:hypothetical protein
MPTASVKPYLSDRHTRARFRYDVWLPIAVLVALIVVAALAPRLKPGPFIASVTVVNHSEYVFDVDVAGAKADGWMPLGAAPAGASTSISAVFDQGSTWTFRFSVEGRMVGEIVALRADLARAGWQVVIPARFTTELRVAGVAPTA